MLDAIVKNSILNPLADCFVPGKKIFKIKKEKAKKIYSKEKILILLEELESNKFNKDIITKCVNLCLYMPCIINMKSEILCLKLCLLAQLIDWNGIDGHSLISNSEFMQKRGTALILKSGYSKKIKELPLSNLGIFLLSLWASFRSLSNARKMKHNLKDYAYITEKKGEQSTITCSCPQVFGCIIPPDFFGNPFNFNYQCKVNHTHIGSAHEGILESYYSPYDTTANEGYGIKQETSTEYLPETNLDNKIKKKLSNLFSNPLPQSYQSNDCIKTDMVKEVFEGYEENEINNRHNLDFYSSQLVDIVTNVCQIVTEKIDNDSVQVKDTSFEGKVDIKSTVEEDCKSFISDDEWNPRVDQYSQSLWDDNLIVEIPNGEVLEDNGFHPLLDEGVELAFDEGVAKEVEEILSQSLSPEKSSSSPKKNLLPIGEECLKKIPCDPPCSVWCDSLNFTCSKNSSINESNYMSLKTYGSWRSSNGVLKSAVKKQAFVNKPSYKRSFSANDCLSSCYCGEKGMQEAFMSHGFDPLSRERLILLRKDPVTYFRRLQNHNGQPWQDGINSLNSTDSFPGSYLGKKRCTNNQDYYGDQNQTSSGMWGPFDGEGCLWQSLPDCVSSQEHMIKPTHRRVRDLRRQRSLN